MDHLNIDFKPMIAPTSMMTYIVDLDAYECHGGGDEKVFNDFLDEC